MKKIKKWKGHGEVRLNDDGSVDEIVIKNCDIHLEQMTGALWWLGVYTGKRSGKFKNRKEVMHVRIYAKNLKSRVKVNTETDDNIIACGFI